MGPRQERSRFHITVWPGAVVPVPHVRRWPAEPIADGAYLRYAWDPGEEYVELPDELYLRELFGLDDRDADALAAWSGTWGMLTGFGDRAYERLTRGVRLVAAPLEDETREAQAYAAEHELPAVHVVATEVVAAHVRTLRALARHWRAHVEHPRGRKALLAAWSGHVVDVGTAWDLFEKYLNAALAPFQVRVQARAGRPAGVQDVNGYSAMALQLANHVAEAATYRRCANETCGQLFVRQRDGAIYEDQRHSTGVMYCEPRCARAQAQREYRRRKRQESER